VTAPSLPTPVAPGVPGPAFQADAFQNNGFQSSAAGVVCTPVFQPNAFQDNAFQICPKVDDAKRDGGTNSEADDRARLNRLRARAALLARQAEELAAREKPKAKAVKAAARKVIETLEQAREAGGALLSDDYIIMLDQLIVGLRMDFLGPSFDPGKTAMLAIQAQAAAAVANELRALQQDEEDAIVALLVAA
jgi:hypothetical protein